MKSRALPNSFDLSQALHAPYGTQTPNAGMSIQSPVYTTYDASSPTRYISSHASDCGSFAQPYPETGVIGANGLSQYGMNMPFEKTGMSSASVSGVAHPYQMSSGRPHDSPMQSGGVGGTGRLAMAHDLLTQQLPRLGGAVQPTLGPNGPAMMYGISAWAIQAPQSQANYQRSASLSSPSAYGHPRGHGPHVTGSVEELADDGSRADDSLVSTTTAQRYPRAAGNGYYSAPTYAAYNATTFSVAQGVPQTSSGMQWPAGTFPPHQ